MQDRLFNPSNEWHEYKGCRLLRARAVFAARQGFVYVDHPHVKEIHLVDVTDTSESDEPPAMVAGYIVLSARTTLAVFRGILPGTTRFFFLSVPLLRLVRELRRPAPSWCAGVLCGMQLLVENNCINKGPVDCMQNMSGYYTGLACLILFDARGATDHGLAFTIGAACGAVLLLSLKFIPLILHRPQQLVDTLCNDILCITAHAVCIGTVVDPALRQGCALHSACFIAQHRFIGCMPSLATTTMVHTMLILLLLAAYTHGPRIPDVHRFMLSAVCPHALELLAQLLTHAHRVAVIAAADT